MGFRYLRSAGSGTSAEGSGRLSSVNCGDIESSDRAM